MQFSIPKFPCEHHRLARFTPIRVTDYICHRLIHAKPHIGDGFFVKTALLGELFDLHPRISKGDRIRLTANLKLLHDPSP